MICLVLSEKTVEKALTAVQHQRNYIDLVELRADLLNKEELAKITEFPRSLALNQAENSIAPKTIFTLRKPVDGGQWRESEETRLKLFCDAIDAGFDYIDLEADLPSALSKPLEESAARKNVGIIRSFHDFEGVPSDLVQKMKTICRSENEIPKGAVFPKNSRDQLALIEAFAHLAGTRKVLLGMGEYGFPTRVLAGPLGSEWTYASQPGTETAPGQVSPEVLCKTFRLNKITPRASVYGIIGNPVLHTKSPAMHNSGYEKTGDDNIYVPFPVDDLECFFKIADHLDIRGLSVTVPHKEKVTAFLESLGRLSAVDSALEAVGACNTLVRDGSTWQGMNTDAAGFWAPLKERHSQNPFKTAAVIGAGGASRAALFALKEAGIEVSLFNRTVEKAEALSREFLCKPHGLSDLSNSGPFDLIIQTSSAGMHPLEDVDPSAGYQFTGNEIAYDMVYAPEETLFLKRAKEAGCSVMNGMAMLKGQGFLQFYYFTGHHYPV